MMSVGPKSGIASSLLETGKAGVSGTAGESAGEGFVQIMAGAGTPLTLEGGGEGALQAFSCGIDQKNLTIKTFQKLLGVNSGLTELDLASAEDELTDDGAKIGLEELEGMAILFLPTSAVPAQASPTGSGADADKPASAEAALKSAPVLSALLSSAAAVAQATEGDANGAETPLRPKGAGEQPFAKSGINLAALGLAGAGKEADAEDMGAIELPNPVSGGAKPGADIASSVDAALSDIRTATGASTTTTITSLISAPIQASGAAQPAQVDMAGTPVQAGEVVDPMVEQQLDLAHEGEWLDRLARDIVRSSGSDGGLRFRLNPENLGSLHVELTQGASGASLRLTTDTEAARAIIADAQPRLVAEARAQGVRIAETHVDLGANGHSASGEQRRQNSEQQQGFVRTSGGRAEAGETPRSVVTASERYA